MVRQFYSSMFTPKKQNIFLEKIIHNSKQYNLVMYKMKISLKIAICSCNKDTQQY